MKARHRFIPPILSIVARRIKERGIFKANKHLIAKNIELRDKHKGSRCFIIGSGSSIKKQNLKPLKNEIVIALNNFYVHPDFQEIMQNNIDKYYMVAPIHSPQTEQEWMDWFKDMDKHTPNNAKMLFGLNKSKINIKYILHKYHLFQQHQLYWYCAEIRSDEYYNFNKQHINIGKLIWQANSASIYALINAIYMGFSEIYLLGMDHNHICLSEDKWRFCKPGVHQKDEENRTHQNKSHTLQHLIGTTKIFKHYQMLDDNCDAKIINCSDISLLDIFEYKSLQEVLK